MDRQRILWLAGLCMFALVVSVLPMGCQQREPTTPTMDTTTSPADVPTGEPTEPVDEPAPETPVEPDVSDMPAEPVAVPAPETPTEPAPETPAEPAPETPAEPAPEAPAATVDEPAPETPAEPAPEAPAATVDEPAPETPAEPAPETPMATVDEPAPETPAAPAPETPAAPAPETPAAPVAATSVPVGLPPLPVPDDNAMTADKIELGKLLYFDKRLSKDGTIACATCHDPNKGWAERTATSTGIDGQVGGRNSPTVINAAYAPAQFWDGRAASLEEQALGPIENPIEMGHTLVALVPQLNEIAGSRRSLVRTSRPRASPKRLLPSSALCSAATRPMTNSKPAMKPPFQTRRNEE